MPVVTVNWLEGRTQAQKQELVSEITQLVHRVGGSPLERITGVVQDVPAENWGRGGQLVSTLQAASPTPPARDGATPARPALHQTAFSLPLLEQQVRMFDLEQPRFEGMPVIGPHKPGYLYFLYRRHSDDYRPDEMGVRSSAGTLRSGASSPTSAHLRAGRARWTGRITGRSITAVSSSSRRSRTSSSIWIGSLRAGSRRSTCPRCRPIFLPPHL